MCNKATGGSNIPVGRLSEGVSALFVNSEAASSQNAAVTWAPFLISQRNIPAHDPHMFDHNVTEKSY